MRTKKEISEKLETLKYYADYYDGRISNSEDKAEIEFSARQLRALLDEIKLLKWVLS